MNINKLTLITDNYEFLTDNTEYSENHPEFPTSTIIIYSYKNGHWPETTDQLNKNNIDYSEFPDNFGEFYILINPINQLTNY